ncbi:S49 family peptidase [Acidocella sp.]|uniref:S49 family peptidase n=1 Tax=Acidocella sp. TaxID=50710 RepID=UPI0026364C7F|nr:S49 family peptidase [Acidocella sp.]
MRLPFLAPKIPVLVIRGLIAPRAGLVNLETLSAPLAKAAALARRSKTLVLAIESPGGSAAQSDLLGQAIRRQAEAHNIAITAVIGDVGASGGYWLACTADRIIANRLSIVGSIGVVSEGFGLDEFIHRHGITRRTRTAGAHKRRNDMFAPPSPEDETFTQDLLDQAHETFKSWVRERRGQRLCADEDLIFDGGYMLGQTAHARGLIDGFGDVETVVRELGGKRAQPVYFRPKPPGGLLARLLRGGAAALLDALEERSLTARLR